MCSRGVTNEESDKRKEHDEQKEHNCEKVKRENYVLCAGQIVALAEYQDYQEGL